MVNDVEDEHLYYPLMEGVVSPRYVLWICYSSTNFKLMKIYHCLFSLRHNAKTGYFLNI